MFQVKNYPLALKSNQTQFYIYELNSMFLENIGNHGDCGNRGHHDVIIIFMFRFNYYLPRNTSKIIV